jgi:hypothetical protein
MRTRTRRSRPAAFGKVRHAPLLSVLPKSLDTGTPRHHPLLPSCSKARIPHPRTDRFAFIYLGRSCVVHEPFGDNSRYWIGPVAQEPAIDMTAVRDAFSRFQFRLTFDRDFNR